MQIRLNKYLACLGIASRRQIDTYIHKGQIKVNQDTAQLGQKIDPDIDKIFINSKPVSNFSPNYQYLILNKPKYVLTTTKDDRGRTTVLDLVKTKNRFFPVGRLDYLSTGLVLLTNDGALANLITHPKYHLPKTYLVTTNTPVSQKHLFQIKKGFQIGDQKLLPALVSITSQQQNLTTLKITLYQGLKRQIRHMFKILDLNLLSLNRISIGPINLGSLKLGQSRYLSQSEIKTLQNTARHSK